ncbi:MAG: hypothetical protein ACTSQG_00095 [Promethearchaeota archaeon]
MKKCYNKKCSNFDEDKRLKDNCSELLALGGVEKCKNYIPSKPEILKMAYDVALKKKVFFTIDGSSGKWYFVEILTTTWTGLGFESLYNKCKELLK